MVHREHIGALNPVDGTALEWNPGSNSFEGNKAMELTPRGLITGGDATTQGEYNVGRLAFYDFNSVPASNGVETTITDPIEGRVKPINEQFTITGNASANQGRTVQRVEVEIQDRDSRRYLNDDLTTWGSTTSNTINATLATPNAGFDRLVAAADDPEQPRAEGARPHDREHQRRGQLQGDEEVRDVRY